MTYFRDSTDPAYREYCAKIVSLQKRFSQQDRDRIVREFLSEGLNAKEVASHYGLSGAQVLLGTTSRTLRSCVKQKTLRMKSSKR